MNAITILNTILANNSDLYQERIPTATDANFSDVGEKILSFQATKNEFLDALVNKICFQSVSNRRFKNPLAILKKGGTPYGTTEEEIYTNPVKAKAYDGKNTSDMLEVNPPDTKTIYHVRNREDKYPVSITNKKLQVAFKSPAAFTEFVGSIMTAMYAGDEMDEYVLMRKVISTAIAENRIPSHSLTYNGDEATSKDLVKLLKTLSFNMSIPEKQYNGYNLLNAEKIEAGTLTPAITWAPVAEQILLIRSDVDAATDVEVLAKAFNMTKTDFLARKIVVDSFGDADTLAVIADEKMFKFRDDDYAVDSFYNGSNRTTNYWLHHWQTISLSLFANGVAIKQAATA